LDNHIIIRKSTTYDEIVHYGESKMTQHVDPKTVLSPKASVRDLKVVFDGGLWDDAKPDWSGWSVATMLWDGDFAVGVRWNGRLGEGVGNPQSRGLPTWFILPRPFMQDVLDRVDDHLKRGGEGEKVPPRRRLLDLIAFVRAASDDELNDMLGQMNLKPAKAT
jgi:hypothetical protein